MPKGFNKVRFELHGELYVEVGDLVYTIKNPYDYTPEFVKIKQVDGKWYVDGFEPQEVASSKKKKKSLNVKDE